MIILEKVLSGEDLQQLFGTTTAQKGRKQGLGFLKLHTSLFSHSPTEPYAPSEKLQARIDKLRPMINVPRRKRKDNPRLHGKSFSFIKIFLYMIVCSGKTVPLGTYDCLKGMKFHITGILSYLKREEAIEYIQQHRGLK